MDSFRNYDSDMACAPEDRRGYREEPPAPEHDGPSLAEVILARTRQGAAALAGVSSVVIAIGSLLPDVVDEMAELSGVKVDIRPYEPGPYLREACRYGSGAFVLFSINYRHMGVSIECFGTRPATAAEIAAVSK